MLKLLQCSGWSGCKNQEPRSAPAMLADMTPKEVSRYLLEKNVTSSICFPFRSGRTPDAT